ncbi:MAG TPA: YciI family protein [Trebonia sp.]|nr:YciI family protein [Trebonia sp.]
MKYLMIVCFDPSVSPAEAEGGMDIDAWVAEMDGRGVRLEGRALEPGEATTVRVRGGQTLISDGPFAETKELMVGYDMLECKDLDEAIEVASRHPLARRGATELRPFGTD